MVKTKKAKAMTFIIVINVNQLNKRFEQLPSNW